MDTDQRLRGSTNRAGRDDGDNHRFRRPERIGARAFAPLGVLIAAALTVVSLTGPGPSTPTAGGAVAGGGSVSERQDVVVPASTTATAGPESWGYSDQELFAYARQIGSVPAQRFVAWVSPHGLSSGIYAYCKAPLPGTSRFQYRAAIPVHQSEFHPAYQIAWVPGGTLRFTRLMGIPRC